VTNPLLGPQGATYTYGCQKIHGPGDKPVVQYPVEEKGGKLYVRLT